jgi:uncharacterized lipoprotein YbaY
VPVRRTWIAAAALACVAALAACGSTTRPATPPVRLTIASPQDGTTTLAGQVLVRGTVAPAAATVLVGGRQASVSGGSFSARVALQPGSNVIDVLAGAPWAPAAMSALRVYRELPVAIPKLDGSSVATARAALRRLGLSAQVHESGGFFQSLLPLSKHVCATEPPAGRLLAPGSTVVLQIAKVC